MPRALDRSEKCRSLSLRLSQTCQLSDPWAVTTEDASKAMRVRIRVCDDFMATPFIYHSGIVPVVRVCTILANRYSSYLKKALQQPPALPPEPALSRILHRSMSHGWQSSGCIVFVLRYNLLLSQERRRTEECSTISGASL